MTELRREERVAEIRARFEQFGFATNEDVGVLLSYLNEGVSPSVSGASAEKITALTERWGEQAHTYVGRGSTAGALAGSVLLQCVGELAALLQEGQ